MKIKRNKLSLEERNDILKHNKSIQSKENLEHSEIDKKYKGLLPDRSEEIKRYDSEFNKAYKNSKLSILDKSKALSQSLKDAGQVLVYSGPIHSVTNSGIVERKGDSLKQRISNFPKNIKTNYSMYKDGIKLERAYKSSKKFEPKFDSDIEKKKQNEHDLVSSKYKKLYKSFKNYSKQEKGSDIWCVNKDY